MGASWQGLGFEESVGLRFALFVNKFADLSLLEETTRRWSSESLRVRTVLLSFSPLLNLVEWSTSRGARATLYSYMVSVCLVFIISTADI